MELDIRLDEADHARAINQLNELVNTGEDLRPAIRAVSRFLLENRRRSFDLQQAPDGTPWQSLAANTVAQRLKLGKDGPILQRDRHLLGSIDSFWSRPSAAAGTNLRYAATHLFGDEDGGIPARPFLGLEPADTDEILNTIGRHLGFS